MISSDEQPAQRGSQVCCEVSEDQFWGTQGWDKKEKVKTQLILLGFQAKESRGWVDTCSRPPRSFRGQQVIPSTSKSPCHTGSPESGVELFLCLDKPQIESLVTISQDATFFPIFRALLASQTPATLLVQVVFCL